MAIPNPLIKFTYEDYLNTPEDKRYELLDGDLVALSSPEEFHQRISILLGSKLVQFAVEHSLGRIYHAPFDVVLSDMDVVQPDLIFVSNERADIITPANIQGAPDLVVEILSPSTAARDKTFKRSLYARHGITEYWMVDLTEKTITVLRLDERGFEDRRYLRRRRNIDFAHIAHFESRRYILSARSLDNIKNFGYFIVSFLISLDFEIIQPYSIIVS